MADDASPGGLKRPELTLPEAEAAALRAAYAEARVILEYGSGGSTAVAAELPGKTIFSVESDKSWAKGMQAWFAANPPASAPVIHYGDIGQTKAWGHPKSLKSHRKWPGYALSVWDRPDFVAPDTVLIDGRFRSACFMTVLLKTKAPVTVLWDDYIGRPRYARVESLVKPVATYGRMVRFDVVPMALPAEALGILADSFQDPL